MVLPVSNLHWIDKIIEERLLTEEIKITQSRVVEDLRKWFRVADNNNTNHFTTAEAFALSVERAIRLYEPYPDSGSDELVREAKRIAQREYNRVRETTLYNGAWFAISDGSLQLLQRLQEGERRAAQDSRNTMQSKAAKIECGVQDVVGLRRPH
ncbi:hypothetical protein FOZ62_025616 [Perkinsus olseni]|uniref:Uncharacterized protein n=1 Tax=Perkinsus olseni TaxID=32597 RepID=A0A7J6T4J5_PEROL|nr:hypothetical protein FOZ62_025616 [Perkinsus olseni]